MGPTVALSLLRVHICGTYISNDNDNDNDNDNSIFTGCTIIIINQFDPLLTAVSDIS